MRWYLVLLLFVAAAEASPMCKCIPSEPCWPSLADWQGLNETISGQLIHNEPVAISCYPGPEANATECALIDTNWSNNTFQQQYPVGYSYPLQEPCPPVNVSAGEKASGQCTLGNAPVYTVNATEVSHLVAGVAFARERNLRLVVRNTGHDLLGRSAGFGSLQVWIRGLRNGIEFHESFEQEGSEWKGAAFTIRGGYTWSEVYAEAEKKSVIVVGGGTPSVGSIGGWMQGGGHSPATHNYGLGADNVLQAKVLLADGSVVTASPTSNPDLFFAIRGGGPGSYGIVLETTIKAYPTVPVIAQTLAFAPLTPNDTSIFTELLTDLYQSFPALATAGWSGYGTWSIDGPAPVFATFDTGYAHSIANFNTTSIPSASASFAPMLAKLQAYNGTRIIAFVQYTSVPSYAEYYNLFSGVEPPAGTFGAVGARFLDTKALTANQTALRSTLKTIAGISNQQTTNVVEFFGAPQGQIAVDGQTQPVSGVNPAWREMVVHQIVSRGWTQDTPAATVEQIERDVLFVKQAALKKLAPNTGAYMNEANYRDPDYKRAFYGSHYDRLDRIKREHDPQDLFYCPTCVGSERWQEEDSGQLCRVV